MKGMILIMVFIKAFILLLIFLTSLHGGKIIAKKYSNRVSELKEMKNALNMFLTKIKFTYESVPETFKEIGNNVNGNIGQIFRLASEHMKEKSAGDAWEEVVEKTDTSFSEIKLVQDFLNTQIDVAERERQKNEKLYKTLGGVVGLAVVIILI